MGIQVAIARSDRDLDVLIASQLRHVVRELERSPETRRLRTQAGAWLQPRLEEWMYRQLGRSPAEREDFLSGAEPLYQQLRQQIMQTLALPEEQYSPLRTQEKKSNADGAYWLDRTLFQHMLRSIGVSPSTWRRIAEGSKAPSEATLQKLIHALALTDDEAAQLRRLVIKDVFDDLSRLRPRVRELVKDWRRDMAEGDEEQAPMTAFLAHSDISPTAMHVFQHDEPDDTSQKTLLKLLIAFGMDETAARAFLALVDSGFLVRRDLVVLSCIRSHVYQIHDLERILDCFNDLKPPYQNLYKLS